MTGGAAAWVAGEPLEVSDVDAREAALRSGPASAALPGIASSEGRQLRRWLVQLMAAERLVAGEAAALGISPAGTPALTELAEDTTALLELGSVAAALLSQNPMARAVFQAVTSGVRVEPELVARFHATNPELFRLPESRVVRHLLRAQPPDAAEVADRPRRTLRRGELTGAVEDAVFAAGVGTVVGPVSDPLGWHVLRVEEIRPESVRPLAQVRGEIERRLLAGRRRRAFLAWLDGRGAELVVLAEGYEHPGDPGQPDNTHRH